MKVFQDCLSSGAACPARSLGADPDRQPFFPEDPDLMHQRNEKISEERFFSLIRIYAEAIRRLASADFTLEER